MVWLDECRVVADGRWHGMGMGTAWAWHGARHGAFRGDRIWVNLCGGEKHKLSQHHLPSLELSRTTEYLCQAGEVAPNNSSLLAYESLACTL